MQTINFALPYKLSPLAVQHVKRIWFISSGLTNKRKPVHPFHLRPTSFNSLFVFGLFSHARVGTLHLHSALLQSLSGAKLFHTTKTRILIDRTFGVCATNAKPLCKQCIRVRAAACLGLNEGYQRWVVTLPAIALITMNIKEPSPKWQWQYNTTTRWGYFFCIACVAWRRRCCVGRNPSSLHFQIYYRRWLWFPISPHKQQYNLFKIH